jgi:excisionase family DNA binding protein
LTEPSKNPFDLLIDQIRTVVRDEIKAAAANGNGYEETNDPKDELRKSIRQALSIGALLTAEQLAEVLQVNKATVYEWVKSKTIPYVSAGCFVRFNLNEVLESQRKKESTA